MAPDLCNFSVTLKHRKIAGRRKLMELLENKSLSIRLDIDHDCSLRLKSKKPAHVNTKKLTENRYYGLDNSKSKREKSNPDSHSGYNIYKWRKGGGTKCIIHFITPFYKYYFVHHHSVLNTNLKCYDLMSLGRIPYCIL